jgi:hypothetical protein
VIEIVPATEDHAWAIQANLHPEHEREMVAYGQPVAEALTGPLSRSVMAYTGLVDGEPTAMWGAEPPMIIGPIAFVWMLGTPLLRRHGKTIAVESRRFVDYAQSLFSTLECHVDPRYDQAMRWVRWLGFTERLRAKSLTGYDIAIWRKEA